MYEIIFRTKKEETPLPSLRKAGGLLFCKQDSEEESQGHRAEQAPERIAILQSH